MKIHHASRLAAKVAARNHVHTLALSHASAMLAALWPFVGKQVIKADGSLMSKVRKALPADLPHDHASGIVGSYYTTGHGYTIAAIFKTCHSAPLRHGTGDGAEYAEATVYLGDLANGVLSKLYDAPTLLRTDYTEEEIIASREELKAAQRALSAAQGKLYHFGEWDQ